MGSSPAASFSKRRALSAWSLESRSHREATRRKYSDRPSSAWRSANLLAALARASSARATSASRRASSEYVTPATAFRYPEQPPRCKPQRGLARSPSRGRRPLSRRLSDDLAVLHGAATISLHGLEVSAGAPLLVCCLPRKLLGGVLERCLTRSCECQLGTLLRSPRQSPFVLGEVEIVARRRGHPMNGNNVNGLSASTASDPATPTAPRLPGPRLGSRRHAASRFGPRER
jgi:hypothetical protein